MSFEFEGLSCRHWTTWLEFPLLVAVITALIGWLGAPFTPRTMSLQTSHACVLVNSCDVKQQLSAKGGTDLEQQVHPEKALWDAS